MKDVKAVVAKFGQEGVRLLKGECRRGWIDIAERIGRFEGEFSRLVSTRDGFDPSQRFVLEKCLAGDFEAVRLRDSIIRGERWRWLGESPPDAWESDLRASYFENRQTEFFRFRAEHYPWATVMPGLASDLLDPWPDVETILTDYALRNFKELGFQKKGVRSTKRAWKITTEIGGRRVSVEFGKGSIQPSTLMTGSITIPDFDFAVSIAYPLFFSGGPHFLSSKTHPFILQLERFFAVFRDLLPQYKKLIEETVHAGNEVVNSLSRRSR